MARAARPSARRPGLAGAGQINDLNKFADLREATLKTLSEPGIGSRLKV